MDDPHIFLLEICRKHLNNMTHTLICTVVPATAGPLGERVLWPATFAMYQLLSRVNPVSDGHLPDAASGQSNVRFCPC